jgi:amino acid adenylation domain-containing protein/non-ribosomal peptide synthase protein (TIGR01720 family)
VEENFFELGGDSILSIQVVSRARRAGVRITPRQLFENPTVAALARLAGTAVVSPVEDGTVTGEVVPTPIQHRFFERELPEPHHFNMSLLLAPAEVLDPAALERAVARLVEHHDALRMRARRTASGWRQEIVGPTAPPFTVVDLAGLPDAARPAALDRAVAAAQRSLDLARGPLARFVLLRTGGERPQRLLAAVHHLVVDGVSWRILLEDLRSAYEQALGGGPVSLPPRTTSFPAWAERLAAYAASPAAAAEAGYWLAAIPADLPALPVDPADGTAPGAAAGSVHVVLPAGETRALLQDVPAAYRTQVNDALLAALARAFAGGLGDGRLLVDLEGHGREDLFADVDLSRTVGWFTSVYPVLLDVRGAADQGAALKAVKEQLRRVPNRGIGYGVLRWLGPDPAVREALAALPRARVSFNYLGQVDGSVSGGAFFTLAPESPGRQVSPRAGRTHMLEVVGAVEGGELRLRFTYGGEFHRREAVEALAGRFVAELRALVDHCRAPGAGGCTPSDFPLAGLDQAALDRLWGDARDVEDVYPLSPMQEGMLFHTLYAPGMGEYVGQFGFVLRGRLDVEAFRRAWQGVVERHDALRSGFVWEELDRPLQVVRRRAPLEFRLDDWRPLAAGAQVEAMERHLAEDRARGFELPRAPLMRLALFRTGDAEHRLVWTYHHAVLDGWSLSLVFRDVVALYDAHAQGRAAPPAGGRSYRDYVAWLQEQDLARAERFWRETLAGFSAPTPLGIERGPGPRSGYATERARVPEAVTAKLQALARRESLTLGTVVQGAWALLLSRYGGEDDVAFGAVVSGRPAELEGVEDTVGLFINTLPVRVRTRPDERVLPWLRGLQALNVAMREHEYAPLGQVQRWSDVPAGEPLFRSIFVFENYPVEDVMAGAQRELTVQRTMALDHTGYPLTVGAAPGRELAVYVEYESARFEGAAVGRMLEHVGVLLEGMASGPERALSTLGLLTAAERARVVEAWNDTARPFPGRRCIHDLVAEQAARTPDAPAVLSADGILTYAGLHASAGRLASRLRAGGVGPEARVAVCTGRSPEMAVAILGTLRAGAAYVPLDPAYPPERLAYLLRDSGARVLLTQRSLAGGLPATDAEVVFLDAAGAGAPEPDGAAAEPGNAAYVIYTSGSTGLPKGVVVEHRSVVAYATDMAARLGLGPDHRILQFASPGFDVVVEELFPAWVAGAAVVFSGADLFSPDELLRVIAGEGVTGLELPTAYWHEWVRELAEAGRRLPECVRFVIVGGERVSPERLEQWARLETPLVHVFGLTETAVTSTTLRLEAGEDGSGWENLPVGSPTANTRLYVLDPAGEPVPAGVPGELFIGGPGVARGYHGRPELTAGKFVPDPFGTEPGDRLYRTGDRVRWLEGGALEFLGRIDHQVKVRGYRIEPGEVEAALRTHPGVRDAAVLAREDAPGDRRLVGYVVAGGEPPSAGELREWLKARLPEYMVPGAYVVLDALPLTPNGKTDRRALPAPDGPSGPDRAYAAPGTPAERVLAGVWAELLRVERVGVEDDFFELGGDSILSIQVVSRARRAGVFVTPRQVFEHPTVAALARVAGTEPARLAEQGAVIGPVELTPVQAWFFAQEVPGRHRWNMSRLFEVRRPLDPGVLERAAARLLEHHDALRLRFRPDGATWRQENAAPGGAPCVARIDLSALDEEETGRALERAADALQGSLRLDRGPLLRMGCFARGRGRTDRLLVAVHHLVTDGVSWRVLLEDLQAACEQAARGEPVALPPKSTSFRAWAARLAEHARSGGFDAELPFWTDDARRGVPALPVDHPGGRAANTVGSARAVPVSLGEDETTALLQEAPRAYRTQVNDLLLAALARALSAWTGDGRLLVQVEGHGREELFADVDLSRTVGWFTTTYPVLLDLRGADGEGAALMRVKEQLRAVPGRGIGYGALRWLGSDAARAALGEIPDPEVHFEYLGQFDQTLAGDALLAVAGEPAGRAADPRGARPYLLGVSGGVLGGRLRMALGYSEAVHRRETVERLAERFAAELRALVAHCTSPGAGGCTPSDFPLAGLDQARLHALVGAGRDVEDVYPLTPMQQGMLFHTLLAPGGGAYVAQFGFRLLGRLDAAAFEGAWRETVRRHAALRTGIVWEGADEPMQVVRRRVDLDVAREDWRDAGAAEQEARREAYLREDRARGFDPASPPLMRVALFCTGDEEHELVWTHHQMAFDGWSLPLVFRDVAALYGALSKGRAPEPARPRPYRDYVAWLVRRDLAAAEAFWREALRGLEAATPFGVDRALAVLPPGEERYGEARRGLGEDATASLLALARREGVTPNTLVQGAWALLLSRYSGEQDVVFGTTVSGRPGEVEGVEEMVGLFINTLPVRVRAAPEAPLAPWLRGVQEWNAALREHEHSPLVQVQRWSGVPAGEPLFESILVFQNYPVGEALGSGERRLRVVRRDNREQADYPVTLNAKVGGELTVRAEYDRRRFEPGTVERMLEHLGTLLAGMAAGPERPLASLSLLTDGERRRVLEGSSGPAAEVPARCIHELVSAQAARTPDAAAVVSGGAALTYADLDARSTRLARLLRERGVGPGAVVGVCVERSPAMAVGTLGILKAGGAYLPLDPAYPADRLAYLLADAGASLLLTQSALRGAVPGFERALLLDALDLEGAGSDPRPVPDGAGPGELAYVIYTSGSTGAPKGVMVEHGSLAGYAVEMAARLGLGPGDRFLQFASPGFDVVVEELFPAWVSGAAVVFSRDDLFAPDELMRVVADEGVTCFELPTAYWHEWVRELAAAGGRLPPAVRFVIIGGERVSPERLEQWARLDTPLVHVFGLTETTVTSTLLRLEAGEDGGAWPNLPVGRPLANAAVYVLDRAGEPVPPGVPGELFVGGPGVARGYLGRPELTAARFVPDPFPGGARGGARLYRTGDRVRRLPDGNLEFLGRTDAQIKVRGFRIEPGEVEAALRAHPGVREAVVVVREDVPGDRRLVGYVVPETEVPPTAELRAHLKARLPEHMVPNVFVALDAVPLTPNGKTDRRALPAPEGRPDSADAYAAPESPVERVLAEVWREVLRVERVGVDDDFFELGGDSILSIQVVSRARRAGVFVTPRQLFESPTVAGLARVAAGALSTRAEQGPVTGPVELTPAQAWFFEREVPARHHWNMSQMFEAPEALDPAALERAVSHLAAHHDALRLRFREEDGAWRQENAAPDGRRHLLVVDLAAVAEERQRQALGRAAGQMQAGLELERGPLLRAALFRRGEGRSARAMVAVHHLVMDGVSWRILLEDLQTAYGQASRGEPPALPEKTTSFRRWAARLAEHARAGGFDAELPYWTDPARRGLAPLPVDFPGGREANTTGSTRTVSVALETGETTALLQEVPKAYRTQVGDVLLGALARAAAGWTGDGRLLVNLEGHGREEIFEGVDLTRTVGWFTTMYPVLLDLRGVHGEGETLVAVKEQLRSVPGKGLGYGALRWLGPEAAREALRGFPEPEVHFEYLGQFDQALSGDSLLRMAPESAGPDVDPRGRRQQLLVVSGGVLDGRLRMAFGYGEGVHRRETVEALAGRFLDELRRLVAHGASAEAGGYTPSDFPLADLDAETLRLLEEQLEWDE